MKKSFITWALALSATTVLINCTIAIAGTGHWAVPAGEEKTTLAQVDPKSTFLVCYVSGSDEAVMLVGEQQDSLIRGTCRYVSGTLIQVTKEETEGAVFGTIEIVPPR